MTLFSASCLHSNNCSIQPSSSVSCAFSPEMLLPSPPAEVTVAEEGDDEGGAVVAVDGGDDVSIARERNGARREGGGGDLREAEIDRTGRSVTVRESCNF